MLRTDLIDFIKESGDTDNIFERNRKITIPKCFCNKDMDKDTLINLFPLLKNLIEKVFNNV